MAIFIRPMDISISTYCSTLCSTADHLLMSIHVLFSVIYIISSSNAFLNLCCKGTCATRVVTCIFWPGMSLATVSGNAHDGLGCLQSTVSKPALTMVKWQLVAQRAQMLTDTILLCSHQQCTYLPNPGLPKALPLQGDHVWSYYTPKDSLEREGWCQWNSEGCYNHHQALFSVRNYFLGFKEKHHNTFDYYLHLWENCIISSAENWAVTSWNALKYRIMCDFFRRWGAALLRGTEWESTLLHNHASIFTRLEHAFLPILDIWIH